MKRSPLPTLAVCAVVAASVLSACHHAPPAVRFAPPGTDTARLRSDFALTDAERLALTPESMRQLTQAQVDQIYERLWSGPMPDGPFRGDLFFPRDANGRARLDELVSPVPPLLAHVSALRIEHLGRAFWKGKVFFRSQGILRNRIEDLAILKPIISDPGSIKKLTFDGETTYLLFPALLSCGESRLDATRRSIVIDYARGSQVEGYREIPDKIAGPDALNILDEVRIVRRGFYLGRAYFGPKFGLNFTLLDPTAPANAPASADLQTECTSGPAARP